MGLSHPRIERCEVRSNRSIGLGGGIAVEAAAVAEIVACEILDNVGGDGGGICVSAASAVISDCDLRENTADFGGGLGFQSALEATVVRCVIESNKSGFAGGGVHSSSALFSIQDTRIAGNLSEGEAGGLYLFESQGTILGTAILGNASQGGTGGIRLLRSVLQVTDAEIVGNGTGIYVEDVPPQNADARSNWWGDASGPYHPIQNPDGLGDAVSDHVDFVPWNLTSSVMQESTSYAPLRCFPNPFRTTTTVRLSLSKRSTVRLQVYDATGRLIATLVDGMCEAREHEIACRLPDSRGRVAASGVYFVRLRAGGTLRSCMINRVQ